MGLTKEQKDVDWKAFIAQPQCGPGVNAAVEAVLAMAPAGAQPLTVICHDCGGSQIFKRDGNKIIVYHDCIHGKHAQELFAASPSVPAQEPPKCRRCGDPAGGIFDPTLCGPCYNSREKWDVPASRASSHTGDVIEDRPAPDSEGRPWAAEKIEKTPEGEWHIVEYFRAAPQPVAPPAPTADAPEGIEDLLKIPLPETPDLVRKSVKAYLIESYRRGERHAAEKLCGPVTDEECGITCWYPRDRAHVDALLVARKAKLLSSPKEKTPDEAVETIKEFLKRRDCVPSEQIDDFLTNRAQEIVAAVDRIRAQQEGGRK